MSESASGEVLARWLDPSEDRWGVFTVMRVGGAGPWRVDACLWGLRVAGLGGAP
jgi:hypothetical protein